MDESLLITKDSRVVNLKDDGTWEYVNFPQSSLDTLQAIKQTPAALKFFHALFDKAGVRVLDTGETFTCVQTETGIEFIDGLNEDSVGYTVQIYAYQAQRLAAYLQTGDIDEIEQYRIVRSLYAPMASAALKNTAVLRFMNNFLISLLIKRKRVVHIDLLSPDPEQENHAYHTLLGVSKQWLIFRWSDFCSSRLLPPVAMFPCFLWCICWTLDNHPINRLLPVSRNERPNPSFLMCLVCLPSREQIRLRTQNRRLVQSSR